MKYLKNLIWCFCFLFLMFLAPRAKAEEKAILPTAIIEEEVMLENEEINRDILILGKKININAESNLKKNLVAIGGDIVIDGKIDEYLIVLGSNVTIKGEVSKNLLVFGGKVLLEEESKVEGYAVMVGNQIEEKGQIKGEKWIESNLGEKMMAENSFQANKVRSRFNLFSILSKLLVLLVLVKILNKKIVIFEKVSKKDLSKNLFYGLLVYFLFPLFLIFLFVTVIGMPLVIILGGLYLLALYLAPLLASIAIGKWLQKIDLFNFKNNYLIVTLGFLLLNAIGGIPFVGAIILILAQFWGLGFIWHLSKKHD
jgi:hypothetical protein